MTTTTHKGSCSCGKIHYQYHGEIDEISMCHCRDCQKAQGTAFVAITPIQSANFQFTQGAEFAKSHQCTANKARVFCGECGSPLYSERKDKPEVKRLRLGTLDTKFSTENRYHMFVDSKAHWDVILDDYPQYPGFKT